MLLARVSGTVVATQKSETLKGSRLLLLEKLDVSTMKGKGDFLVALDGIHRPAPRPRLVDRLHAAVATVIDHRPDNLLRAAGHVPRWNILGCFDNGHRRTDDPPSGI